MELEKRGSILGLISVLIGYLKLSGLKHHLLSGIWENLLGGSHSWPFLSFQKCQPPLQSGEGLPETVGDFQAPSLCCGLETLVPITWASPRGYFRVLPAWQLTPTAGDPREQGRREVPYMTLPWKTHLIFAIFYLLHRQTLMHYGMAMWIPGGRHHWGLLGGWPPPGEQLALPCSWGEAMEWRAFVLTRR